MGKNSGGLEKVRADVIALSFRTIKNRRRPRTAGGVVSGRVSTSAVEFQLGELDAVIGPVDGVYL